VIIKTEDNCSGDGLNTKGDNIHHRKNVRCTQIRIESPSCDVKRWGDITNLWAHLVSDDFHGLLFAFLKGNREDNVNKGKENDILNLKMRVLPVLID
jgi:hypothetical protein